MKRILIAISIAAFILACGAEKNDLAAKREQLIQKKKALAKLEAEVKALEKEIAALDPAFKEDLDDRTLITTLPVTRTTFAHYVEARGIIEAEKNVLITPQTVGKIVKIYVKEGQVVTPGQVIARQDVDVILKNIEQLKTQLELATTLFEKQKRLWEQNIGTEVQYLQAKTNKEALERQLAALQAQADLAVIRAPFGGVIDKVFAKEGEVAALTTPIARLVSLNEIKVVAELSEAHLNRVKVGDEVLVEVPALQETQTSRITYVGQVIDPTNRTFRIEVALRNPNGKMKPEMIVLVKLKDSEVPDAVVIPVSLVQEDAAGKFVYIVDTTTNTVQRRNIEIGRVYDGKAQVLKGLEGNELLVNEGFRFVSEGKKVKITQS
ncbi:RND family efflux transporter MFP subunit [Thermonema lapsum]|uniref:RND family efflux transporter MFP subunit n=1 Tax=Thermonema lapsum TaxID=28195 RepID=A0A846MSZ4_9BACT|nr:efflux RND transporter periplasmic adaptor subunit [Thermonema lapsum]NIK74716.1 RND family efflux transporter MFP subunit [Thermonema lapsum]